MAQFLNFSTELQTGQLYVPATAVLGSPSSLDLRMSGHAKSSLHILTPQRCRGELGGGQCSESPAWGKDDRMGRVMGSGLW